MAIRYSSPIVSDNLISLIDFSNIKSVKFSDDFTFVDIINKENVISSCGNTTLGKKSLYFSGSTGSQLDLQDLITSRIIETNVSFSIWFKLSNLSSDHFLIKTGDEDSDPPINIFFDTSATGVENIGGSDIGGGNTNVITCQFSDSTQDYKFTTSNNIINASQWYNLTVSLDFSSNIHHMYLDGSLVAKWNHTTGSNGIKSHNNSFLLGKGLNGNIGKFYAYRKSLNSEEVKQNYDAEVFRDFDQDSLIDRLVLNASPFDSSVPNRSEKISQLSNDAIFTSIGSTDWTVPSGVYKISVVCIGGGGGASGSNIAANPRLAGTGGGGGALRYVNNIDVTPGETLTVTVGSGGNGGYNPPNSWIEGPGGNGQTSSLSRSGTILCSAAGGKGGSVPVPGGGGAGGNTGIGTGGNGGNGGLRVIAYRSSVPGGGGGAGGYSGNGGAGGYSGFNTSFGSGSGGGAAGGSYNQDGSGAGGGVGLYGEGESGLYDQSSSGSGGAAGSGGSPGESTKDGKYNVYIGNGGLYGGGGGGEPDENSFTGGSGGQGAVRIIWGGCLDGTYYGREFPSSNANQIYSNSSLPFSSIPVLHLDAGDTNSYSGIGITWTDLSGNGYEGILTNEPTYNSSDGGGTIVFDGSNEQVNVGNFTLPTAYTINMFIKFLDTSSGNKAILDFGTYLLHPNDTFTYAPTLRLYLQDGYVKIQHAAAFASTGVLSSFIPTTETWYNLTVTFDGNTAKMYFNSTLNSSGTLVSPSTNYTTFGIANKPLGNGSSILPLNCSISYVEIFDRTLTASEITDNFNALKGRYGL